jgi:hypothetical protein
MSQTPSSVARPGELSPLQKAFARCYVMNGGNATQAALEAGYSPGGSEQIALRNVRHKLVIAEIKRLSVVEVGARLPEIIAKLWAMVEDDKTPAEVKARILFNLMDRGGMAKTKEGPTVQVNIQNNGNSSSALIQEIWASKTARDRALSVIDGTMADRSADDGDAVDALPAAQADEPAAEG